MATTRRRFYNPYDVAHGSTDINTVQSITLNKTYQRLAGQGDNDFTDSFQAKTNLQVNGSLVIQDPVQADALIDADPDDLTWSGTPEAGGVAKNVSVANVEFFSLAETDSHNALDAITLGWNAYNPDGSDPVSVDVDTGP